MFLMHLLIRPNAFQTINTMKPPKHPLLLAAGVGLVASVSAMAQLTIILDMDVSTPPGPGPVPGPLFGPAGLATGFEPGITVTSGSSVTVIAYVVQADLGSPLGAAVPFDSIGLDLSWGTAGDTALLAPTTPALAGFLSSTTPLAENYAIGTFPLPTAPVVPGVPLAPAGVGALPGYTGNIGGAGSADIVLPGSPFPPGQFGGFGAPGLLPPGSYFDVFGVTFTAIGAPGSSVTLTPSGIFVPPTIPTPGAPGLASAGLLSAVLGDATYDSVTGLTDSFTGLPTIFIGGTITIVPEPSTTAAVASGLCLGFIGFRRWRSRKS